MYCTCKEREKGDTEPAVPHSFWWAVRARFLAPETRAVFAGTKRRNARAQCGEMVLPDKTGIRTVYIFYVLLARFLRKGNSGRAACGFEPPTRDREPQSTLFKERGFLAANRAFLSRFFDRGGRLGALKRAR